MKRFFFLLFLFTSYAFSAQNIIFIYELKYKPDAHKDNFITENYYLDVLGKESVFRSEQARYSDSLVEKTGYGLGEKMTFTKQFYIRKNLASMDINKIVMAPIMHDKYFIKITDQLNWKILPDKMKIGDMDCQKATIDYGGRRWTAWFTQSVPLQDGPYIFNGLPGLIITISDDKSDYSFTLVKTKRSNKNNMFALRKGKEISWEAFKKMQMDYYTDPYAEIKTRNIKYQVGDGNGNIIPMNMNTLSKGLQKQIRENNNPIELDHKVEYK